VAVLALLLTHGMFLLSATPVTRYILPVVILGWWGTRPDFDSLDDLCLALNAILPLRFQAQHLNSVVPPPALSLEVSLSRTAGSQSYEEW
jgi:hypothetical protein